MNSKNRILVIAAVIIVVIFLFGRSFELFTLSPGEHVQFRTTDLSYSSGSAIATIGYSGTCGDDLLSYGYVAYSPLISGTCTEKVANSRNWKFISDVPGTINHLIIGNNAVLIYNIIATDTYYICDDDGINRQTHIYRSTDPDADKVDTTITEIDQDYETSCISTEPTQQTCSQTGGDICTSTETCTGTWLTASDTSRCCSVTCTSEPSPTCNTPADTNCDSSVSDIEVLSYITTWINNQISDIEVLGGIQAWVNS